MPIRRTLSRLENNLLKTSFMFFDKIMIESSVWNPFLHRCVSKIGIPYFTLTVPVNLLFFRNLKVSCFCHRQKNVFHFGIVCYVCFKMLFRSLLILHLYNGTTAVSSSHLLFSKYKGHLRPAYGLVKQAAYCLASLYQQFP